LEFTVASRVDVGKRRAGRHQALRVGEALGSTKYFEELVTSAVNAPEQSRFLKNEGPRDQGEEEQDAENATCNPASLRKNVKDIADEDGG
jgi:hypothetical protein